MTSFGAALRTAAFMEQYERPEATVCSHSDSAAAARRVLVCPWLVTEKPRCNGLSTGAPHRCANDAFGS